MIRTGHAFKKRGEKVTLWCGGGGGIRRWLTLTIIARVLFLQYVCPFRSTSFM